MNISASAWPVQLEVFKVQTKAHPPFSRKLVLLFMLMLISSLSKKVHAVVLNISTAFKLVMNWSIASHKMPLPVQFTNDHQFKQLNFVKAVWKTWCFLPKSENWHLGIQRKLSQFPGQLGNIMFLSSGILFWQFQLFRILAKWFLTIGLYGPMAPWRMELPSFGLYRAANPFFTTTCSVVFWAIIPASFFDKFKQSKITIRLLGLNICNLGGIFIWIALCGILTPLLWNLEK